MRGFFGIGIEHGKTVANLGTLWRSAHLLGAQFIFTIGRRYKQQASDVLKSTRHVPLTNYENFDDLYKHLPYGCRMVGIELTENALDIATFEHPQQCVYLLGAEDHGLLRSSLERCHFVVRLPGAQSMNVASAGTVVMYDRWVKAKGASTP